MGKYPLRCFHSELHSAVSEHDDSQSERDVAIDKTKIERICDKFRIYITFHPSKMENVKH